MPHFFQVLAQLTLLIGFIASIFFLFASQRSVHQRLSAKAWFKVWVLDTAQKISQCPSFLALRTITGSRVAFFGAFALTVVTTACSLYELKSHTNGGWFWIATNATTLCVLMFWGACVFTHLDSCIRTFRAEIWSGALFIMGPIISQLFWQDKNLDDLRAALDKFRDFLTVWLGVAISKGALMFGLEIYAIWVAISGWFALMVLLFCFPGFLLAWGGSLLAQRTLRLFDRRSS